MQHLRNPTHSAADRLARPRTLALAVAGALLVGTALLATEGLAQPAEGKRSYRCVKASTTDLEGVLNTEAAKGWRLSQVVVLPAGMKVNLLACLEK